MSVPSGTNFEKLAAGLYLEGLAIDQARNIVWYSDVIAGGIHGVAPNGDKVISLNRKRMWTGGILMNADGSILSSGAGGIMWNHPDTGKSGWLINEIDGMPINGINEMIPDGTGGIYFGTVDLEQIMKGQPVRPAAIYRLSADRNIKLVSDGLGFVNGIMLSLNRKQLYYNETFSATYVFDVMPNLSLTNRRKLMDKEDCDGMTLDAEGNLWITGFKSSDIVRIRADGAPLPPFTTPAKAVTQIRFGGTDLCDVYFTSVPIDGGDNLAVGIQPSEQRSFLYRGRSQSPGISISPAQFKLI